MLLLVIYRIWTLWEIRKAETSLNLIILVCLEDQFFEFLLSRSYLLYQHNVLHFLNLWSALFKTNSVDLKHEWNYYVENDHDTHDEERGEV